MSTSTPTQSMNLTELYTQHQKSLFNFSFSILKDASLAEDAVQTTFLKLMQQEEGKTEGHEVQWLFTVARNTCFKMLNKNNRYCEMEEGEVSSIKDEAPAPDAVLSEQENFSELSEDLQEALSKLSPYQRETLNLRFFSNLSYKEIAEVLETNENAVAFTIHAAKAKLKRFMSFSR